MQAWRRMVRGWGDSPASDTFCTRTPRKVPSSGTQRLSWKAPIARALPTRALPSTQHSWTPHHGCVEAVGAPGLPGRRTPWRCLSCARGLLGDVGLWVGRKSTEPQCGDGQFASMIHGMFMEGEQRGGGGALKVRPHLALEQLRAAKRAGTLAVDYPTEQATTGGLTGTAARPMRSDIVSSRSRIACVQGT
jgi:hypothetical protein